MAVAPPTTVTATGAALSWPAYAGSDLVEYQVHRSIYQTYTPSAATLVAPVGKTSLAYQDTTALPTPTEENDPLKRHFYYYMIAVKTTDGQITAGPTQGVLLPHPRPDQAWLAALGTRIEAADPVLRANALSASAMWERWSILTPSCAAPPI